jgi:phosphoheptose isomerase
MKMDMHTLTKRAKTHFTESAEVKCELAEKGLDSIISAAQAIADVFRNGGKLLLCGNGGSAADCQHIAAELVSVLTQDFNRPGLRAIALTTDTSLITAYANDFGFDGVFARQVETLGCRGDALIGISTSGNSKNVLMAVEAATKLEMKTIALTGLTGGRLAAIVNIAIPVPSTCTQYIQESHITIGHILCDLIECCLFDGKNRVTKP